MYPSVLVDKCSLTLILGKEKKKSLFKPFWGGKSRCFSATCWRKEKKTTTEKLEQVDLKAAQLSDPTELLPVGGTRQFHWRHLQGNLLRMSQHRWTQQGHQSRAGLKFMLRRCVGDPSEEKLESCCTLKLHFWDLVGCLRGFSVLLGEE